MRYLDEMVLGDDDLRKVETCKECRENIENKEGKTVCDCNKNDLNKE